MNVRFCRECHSLILSGFRYCPYCGVGTTRGRDFAELLEAPFSRIEESRKDAPPGKSSRLFEELENRIGRLESEMELLVDELEREKRV